MQELIYWRYYGVQSFREMWQSQEELREKLIKEKGPGELWIVQHPPTISLGRGEKGANLLENPQSLEKCGFDVILTNRGGKVTYHGPGQLVAYPIVSLPSLKLGVKQFVCRLEETMIQVLKKLGICAERKPGYPGVWVGMKKIGSVGIHVRRQVSIHGLALNICPNLSHFHMIQPCGIEGIEMTSVEQEGIESSVEEIIPTFIESFSEVYNVSLIASVAPLHSQAQKEAGVKLRV